MDKQVISDKIIFSFCGNLLREFQTLIFQQFFKLTNQITEIESNNKLSFAKANQA